MLVEPWEEVERLSETENTPWHTHSGTCTMKLKAASLQDFHLDETEQIMSSHSLHILYNEHISLFIN